MDGDGIRTTRSGRCAPEPASEDTDGEYGCNTDGQRAQGMQRVERDDGGVPLLRQRERGLAGHSGTALAADDAKDGDAVGRAVSAGYD